MLFESTQSRLLLALALPVIILSQRMKFSMTTLFTQIILYLALAYNADCLVSGQCKTWAWLVILFPLINTLGYLFFVDKLKLNAPVEFPVPRAFQKPVDDFKQAELAMYGPGPKVIDVLKPQ